MANDDFKFPTPNIWAEYKLQVFSEEFKETENYVLVDPNAPEEAGAFVDDALINKLQLTKSAADFLNNMRRKNGSNLRWIREIDFLTDYQFGHEYE